jgi:hypothetical protein
MEVRALRKVCLSRLDQLSILFLIPKIVVKFDFQAK